MMTDDLTPIIHKFPNGADITAYIVADLHVGSKQFNGKAWQTFKAKVLAEPNSRIIYAGDLMDNNLKSSAGSVFDAVLTPSAQKEWLKREMSDLAEQTLCVVPGNHENRSKKEADSNPLYDVCAKLNLEHLYREYACFMLLRFGDTGADRQKAAGPTRPTYAVCVTHGSGGGMYIGSSANKTERFGTSIDGLDLMVTGHTHRPLTFPVEKIVIDKHNNKVSTQPFRVVTASSWLTYGGYAMGKMLPPTAHQMQEVLFGADKKLIRVTA